MNENVENTQEQIDAAFWAKFGEIVPCNNPSKMIGDCRSLGLLVADRISDTRPKDALFLAMGVGLWRALKAIRSRDVFPVWPPVFVWGGLPVRFTGDVADDGFEWRVPMMSEPYEVCA